MTDRCYELTCARLAQLARAQVSYESVIIEINGNPEVASSSLAPGNTFFYFGLSPR